MFGIGQVLLGRQSADNVVTRAPDRAADRGGARRSDELLSFLAQLEDNWCDRSGEVRCPSRRTAAAIGWRWPRRASRPFVRGRDDPLSGARTGAADQMARCEWSETRRGAA
jgi:hypothetical protein